MIQREMYEIVDAITGIANGCRTLPQEPGAPSLFQATVRMTDTTPYLGFRGDAYNSGAGLTEQAAWDAGIGEAIERYCLSVVRPEEMLCGTWAELQELHPLHPAEAAPFAEVPPSYFPRQAFREDSRLGWLLGESLVDHRPRLAPACLVHIPYAPVFPGEALIAPAISTGSACGPGFEAALLSGLYECIERDAFSIVWLNRLPVKRLALDEPWIQDLFQERFARPNLEYSLFVLELDVAAPTVVSLIRDSNFDPPMLCVGGACRIDIRDAAMKALIESVQGWSWCRYHRLQNGVLPLPASFDEIQSFEDHVRMYACSDMSAAVAFLEASESQAAVSDYPRNTLPPAAIVEKLAEQIAAAGSDVIVLDLTTPEFRPLGLRVVKAFCPGFQQIEGDHRFRLLGGRRWREAPVRLGYRARPLEAAEVNPYPHPYA